MLWSQIPRESAVWSGWHLPCPDDTTKMQANVWTKNKAMLSSILFKVFLLNVRDLHIVRKKQTFRADVIRSCTWIFSHAFEGEGQICAHFRETSRVVPFPSSNVIWYNFRPRNFSDYKKKCLHYAALLVWFSFLGLGWLILRYVNHCGERASVDAKDAPGRMRTCLSKPVEYGFSPLAAG